MQDQDKTKEQLIAELNEMRRKAPQFETVQKSLNNLELKYREIIDRVNEAVFVVQDGGVKFANPAYSELTGYSKDEVLVSNVIETLVHPDDREMVSKYHAQRQQGEILPFCYNFRIVCKRGNVKWVELNSSLIMWEGKPSALCLATDITKRKCSEESLKETTVFLKTLLNAIPIPIFYKGIDGHYMGLNKSFEEFFGKTNQELVGKSVFDIHLRDMAEIYNEKDLELFHNPGVQVYNSQMKDARGDVHDVISQKSTFSDPQGNVIGLIGVILDITERKRLEEEKENLVVDLQKALSEVKKMSGFLPICASCKKIRDDEGYWQQIEEYISDRSEAQFSHSICPDCTRKLYPELFRG